MPLKAFKENSVLRCSPRGSPRSRGPARAERKDGLMLRCEHSGVDIAYLDTQRDLGVTIEIFSGMPSNGGDPDST